MAIEQATTTARETAGTTATAVHFGRLEELIEEFGLSARLPQGDGTADSHRPIFRVSTQHYARQTGLPGVTYHSLKVIVTARAWHGGDGFPHTGVWVWQVDDYETWHGKAMPGSEWTPQHAYALLDAVAERLQAALMEVTGLAPRKGMYCVPVAYLDIGGDTSLIDLAALRARLTETVRKAMPDHLIEKAERVRKHLLIEPQCGRCRLLSLFWPAEGGRNYQRNAQEVALVLQCLSCQQEGKTSGDAKGES